MARLSSSVRFEALGLPPSCWTRVEYNERRFIRECADHTDGVVISARFLELMTEVLAARVPHMVDLETHRLPFLRDETDDSFGNDAQTPLGKAVALPLQADCLASDAGTEQLVRAAVSVQANAEVIFAPDFAFDTLSSPWLEVNLRCIRTTRELTQDRPVGAWVHVTLATAMTGIMPFVAERYRQVLSPGATVVVAVYFPRRPLDVIEQAAYFRAVGAFARAGFELIVDRPGDLAIPAVATVAAGCVLGTRLYRTVPESPLWTTDINPRIPLSWSDARRGRRLSLKRIAKMRSRKKLPSCCKPVAPDARDKLPVRLHNAHNLREELRRCRELGAAQAIYTWRNSRLKLLRGWAQALDRANADSAEA